MPQKRLAEALAEAVKAGTAPLGSSERAVLAYIFSLPRGTIVTAPDVGDALYSLTSSWANYASIHNAAEVRREWAARLLRKLFRKGLLQRDRAFFANCYRYWIDDRDRENTVARLRK